MNKKIVAGAAVGILALAIGVPGAAGDSLGSTYNNGVLSGHAFLDDDANSGLAMACSQQGTTVSLNLAGKSKTRNLALKVAFTNPSVDWVKASTDGSTPGYFVYNGNAIKDYQSETITVVDLTPVWESTTAQKTDQATTGNPYVYYQDKNGNWQALGHCNQGKGSANIPLKAWHLSRDISHNGQAVKGSCFSTNTKSGLDINETATAWKLTQDDANFIVYSNKVLDTTGGNLTAISGSTNYPIVSKGSSVTGSPWDRSDIPGFHVWGNPIGATLTLPGLNLGKLYPKSAVQGIGGNPEVWLGLGTKSDNSNDYWYLGRCKAL